MSDVNETATESDTSNEREEAEELHEDPELVEKDVRFDDRHSAARESANIDDHRDEPPNSS